jgi:hypothetical protein
MSFIHMSGNDFENPLYFFLTQGSSPFRMKPNPLWPNKQSKYSSSLIWLQTINGSLKLLDILSILGKPSRCIIYMFLVRFPFWKKNVLTSICNFSKKHNVFLSSKFKLQRSSYYHPSTRDIETHTIGGEHRTPLPAWKMLCIALSHMIIIVKMCAIMHLWLDSKLCDPIF